MKDIIVRFSGYGAPTRKTILLVFLSLLTTQASPAAPTVVVAKAASREVKLSGFTRARTVLDLATESTGKVEKVFADVGEAIGENTRFACLDQTFIDLDIESNRTEIERARIDIDYFKKQLARYEELVKKNNSSQQQVDEIQRSLATAGQQLRNLRVRARELQERKKRFCMAAPRGWIVMKRYIEPGEWIRIGDPVAKIGNFSRLLIPFALTMNEYQALQQGADQLRIELPDLGITLPTRIAHVSPEFDEKSRKIVLDLEIEGGPEQVRGGIRADLKLNLPDPSHSVLLPRAAVDERYEQHWVERPDGEQISVVYLGENKSENPGDILVRISHPDILPGQEFVLQKR